MKVLEISPDEEKVLIAALMKSGGDFRNLLKGRPEMNFMQAAVYEKSIELANGLIERIIEAQTVKPNGNEAKA